MIGDLLGPEDRLDVCEIQPELADILDNEILNKGKLGEARRQGRVRLIRGSVEDVDAPDTYDLRYFWITVYRVQAAGLYRVFWM